MNSPDAVDIRLFQRCVPLNALRAESQADLARKATLLHRRAGETLFHIGDDAAQSLYLIERSEEHTSELQSLMRISYAVFCLKKKNYTLHNHAYTYTHISHSSI